MITTKHYGDHEVFFCTEEQEWKDLTSKDKIVFHVSETDLIRDHPTIFTTPFWETIFRMKKAVPTVRILRARSTHV